MNNFSDAPSLRVPVEVEPEPKLSWWWSRDDERFHGPCFSRADAVMEAWSDDQDSGAFVCRAAQREWRTDIFDAHWMADAFDDANEELSDADGDPPSSHLKSEEWKRLAREAGLGLRRALRQHGSMAWGFTHQHPSEWVNIPLMYRAAEAEEEASESNRKDGSSPNPSPQLSTGEQP